MSDAENQVAPVEDKPTTEAVPAEATPAESAPAESAPAESAPAESASASAATETVSDEQNNAPVESAEVGQTDTKTDASAAAPAVLKTTAKINREDHTKNVKFDPAALPETDDPAKIRAQVGLDHCFLLFVVRYQYFSWSIPC
jgi:hypothetical protein